MKMKVLLILVDMLVPGIGVFFSGAGGDCISVVFSVELSVDWQLLVVNGTLDERT
jgi:hypothetical protein